MIFNFLFKKPETDEQRVIRYSDTITTHANHLGKLNKEWLNSMATFDQDKMPVALLQLRQEITTLHPIIDGNLEPYKRGFEKYYDNIKLHLLNNGYIDEPKPDVQDWILNDDGKQMKRLKGHKKYQDYIDKKLKAEIAEMNGKIYWKKRAIISAILGLTVGILISWIAIRLKLPTPLRPALEESQLSTPATQPVKTDSTK